jgi:hypothetical protein
MKLPAPKHVRNDASPPIGGLHSPLQQALALVLVCALTVGLGACASAPMPTDQIAVTTAAIAHAEAAGGATLAASEMGLARDKLRRANLAVAAKAPIEASRLAQQAHVDALLAEAKAESSKAQKAADEVQAASRALREEMGRKAP